MRMLQKEKEVGHTPGSAIFDQGVLYITGSGVGDHTKAADFQLTHRYALPESQVSIIFLTCCMNSSATAPSMIR
jgi:hypothetical protein